MDEISTVTITLDEYRELIKSKTIADTLLTIIYSKNQDYSGISRDEVETLNTLYNKKKGGN